MDQKSSNFSNKAGCARCLFFLFVIPVSYAFFCIVSFFGPLYWALGCINQNGFKFGIVFKQRVCGKVVHSFCFFPRDIKEFKGGSRFIKKGLRRIATALRRRGCALFSASLKKKKKMCCLTLSMDWGNFVHNLTA